MIDTGKSEAADSGGQSSVVGVAILLGATVIALGVLTASVGTLIDGQTARSDATRVADGLDETLEPVERTGHHAGQVSFTDGTLRTAARDLRVYDASGLVASYEIDALVYEHGDRRVGFVGGAVVRGREDGAWLVSDPPILSGAGDESLVVGAAVLGAGHASLGGDGTTARLETNVSHSRRELPADRYRVTIETATPAAFKSYFEAQGATVSRRDIDSDGIVSVVAEYPGTRTTYLVEHRMRLEVGA